MKIWDCKIGECEESALRSGDDSAMRVALTDAYRKITGQEPKFLFAGWTGELTEGERAVVEERLPSPEAINSYDLLREAEGALTEAIPLLVGALAFVDCKSQLVRIESTLARIRAARGEGENP